MSRHIFFLEVVIDDEALATHDSKRKPPPNDPTEWEARDLFVAYEEGIIDASLSVAAYDVEIKS